VHQKLLTVDTINPELTARIINKQEERIDGIVMPQFSVNPHRVDPYKNFRFKIMWDGKYVAGVSKISPLRRVTDVITHRSGGDPNIEHKSPGKTHYDPIVLERGVTHDPEFEAWANLAFNHGSDSMSLKNFRKDIRIEMYNEAGQLALAYFVYRCWVSEYSALPEMDANANAIAIQTIKLENEGWERDTGVAEPAET
jgi:phage tail-like protein